MFKIDLPITSKKQDKLDRASFAESVAKGILEYKDRENFVLGLYGGWGSGKTSIINMVIESINDFTQQSVPIIVRFNPWNYSDQNQLLSQFFKKLSLDLGRKDRSEELKNVAKRLDLYAKLLEPLQYVPPITIPAALLKKFCEYISNSYRKKAKRSLEEVKADLNNLLKKQNSKVVIIIDDIDRLNNTEVRQIFQLVKSLGDFNNTIYLLSFDMDVVCKALSKVQEGNGYDYLAKVIQIPFSVPKASVSEIYNFLFSNLDEIIKDYPQDKFDQRYWQNVFHGGIRGFFNSIRDVNRFINTFRFKYYLLKEEVNIVDLIGISIIEIFLPDLYNKVRENKELFVQTQVDYSHRVDEGATLKNEVNTILEQNVQIEFVDKAKNLLKELFPKLKSVYEGPLYGESYSDKWRRVGRICSEDNFDVFFQLTIPSGRIAKSELETIISKADNLDNFLGELDRLVREGKITEFIERIEDYTDNIPQSNFQTIISALMDRGDSFPKGSENFLGLDNSMRILRIIYQLLKRLDSQEERFEILKTAIEGSQNSIHTIEHEIAVQGQSHGKRTTNDVIEPEEKRLISKSQLETLENIACAKIREWAKDGRLFQHKRLFGILYSWELWGSEEEVKAYVNDSVATDVGLVDFIAKTPHEIKSQSMGDYGYRTEYRINIKDVDHFIKLEDIVPRLRLIKQDEKFDELHEEERRAIELFLDTIDGKIKQF